MYDIFHHENSKNKTPLCQITRWALSGKKYDVVPVLVTLQWIHDCDNEKRSFDEILVRFKKNEDMVRGWFKTEVASAQT